MILELDLAVLLSEAQTLLSVITLLERMSWNEKQKSSSSG